MPIAIDPATFFNDLYTLQIQGDDDAVQNALHFPLIEETENQSQMTWNKSQYFERPFHFKAKVSISESSEVPKRE